MNHNATFGPHHQHVVPAQAGTHTSHDWWLSIDSRLRGNDVFKRYWLKLAKPTALLVLATFAPLAHADDQGVTPYRPSVSTPAQLPTPGQLEFELGALSTNGADGHRTSLPYTFKLAFNQDWGVLLEGEALVSAPFDTGYARGIGDTSVVLKRAFIVDDATAFGLEFGAKLPTARDAIGSGRTDWTINSIYSQDFGKLHMDLNLNATRLGAPDPDASRLQTGLAAAFSHPLNEQWGALAEWSGTHNAGAPSTAQILAALTYAPDKSLVIDVGFAHGLNPASPKWSVFSGFVVPLAKLW
jgi:hypothetical protein